MKYAPKFPSKVTFLFSTLFIAVLCICSAFNVTKKESNPQFISIQELMNSGKLEVSIKSLGGHQQECVAFHIKNITGDTVLARIEPGRRLHCEDTTMQDIFLVKHKNVLVLPHENLMVNGYGFCCKSHHRSPVKQTAFSIGAMAPEGWQKLAKVIDENNFPVKAIQDAVWCLSNDHAISAITDKNPNSVELLRRTVAGIKGLEVPWYTVIYAQPETENQLFSNKHETVTGQINYHTNGNTIISIVVKNRKGQVLKTLIKSTSKSSGNHTYDLNLNVANWPTEEYLIYIYEDYSNLNTRVKFKL